MFTAIRCDAENAPGVSLVNEASSPSLSSRSSAISAQDEIVLIPDSFVAEERTRTVLGNVIPFDTRAIRRKMNTVASVAQW